MLRLDVTYQNGQTPKERQELTALKRGKYAASEAFA
jgi:hypothetical protein